MNKLQRFRRTVTYCVAINTYKTGIGDDTSTFWIINEPSPLQGLKDTLSKRLPPEIHFNQRPRRILWTDHNVSVKRVHTNQEQRPQACHRNPSPYPIPPSSQMNRCKTESHPTQMKGRHAGTSCQIDHNRWKQTVKLEEFMMILFLSFFFFFFLFFYETYFSGMFYYLSLLSSSFFLRDTQSRKSTMCPFCVLIHNRKKKVLNIT